MDSLSFKTEFAKKGTNSRKWVVIDATDLVLGRLCSKVVLRLQGKHKPYYSPNVDCGDSVIIINAEKIRLTGKKMMNKQIVHYTGYPGGQRFETPKEMIRKNPAKLIEHAVKGMLPKTKMGSEYFRHLYVYGGEAHKHTAQNPEPLNITL